MNRETRTRYADWAGGPGAKRVDEWGGPRVGVTCGSFVFVVPSFYPLAGLIVTVRNKHPRVTPTRGAPSFLNDSKYRNNRILSSIVGIM